MSLLTSTYQLCQKYVMTLGDRLVAGVLGLTVLMLIGMIASSWRLVLYPYLIIVGIMILLGIGRKKSLKRLGLFWASAVTIIYIAVYIWLDIVFTNRDTTDLSLIGGLAPSTAIYFFVIWPLGLLVALLYSWMTPRLMHDDDGEPSPPEAPNTPEGDSR